MKTKPYHTILFTFLSLCWVTFANAQDTKLTASDKAADAVCEKLKALDLKAETPEGLSEKVQAMVIEYFTGNYDELLKEFGLTELNDESGNKIGTEIGKKLIKRCPKFMEASVIMAKAKDTDAADATSESKGTISKITSPDFTIITLKEANGRESQFYWLRYFKGSEKFQSAAAGNVGKKVKITWAEMECYVPKANGYYKIKEIKEIQFQ